jgi:uncharacterized protein (TIGR02118 family)
LVKLTVFYGHPTDTVAFDDYYANTHMALVNKIPDLQRFEGGKVVGTPDGDDPPYYRIAELWFESMDQIQHSLSTPEGQEAPVDIPNFATGGATVFISEVEG